MSTTPTAPSGHSHFAWEAPGSPVAIHLNFDVVDRITPEVMKGFMALRRRGAEVGGLLLGHASDGAVTIEDFAMVPCEYASGPSYHLSDNDRANLESAVDAAREKNLQIVGFFRSHTRPELGPDEHDAELLRTYFTDSWAVMLLIRPAATRTATAGFFLWTGQELEAGLTRLEFPFSRRDLGGGDSKMVPVATQPDRPAPRPVPPPSSTKFTFGPPAAAPAPPTEPPPAPPEREIPVPAFLTADLDADGDAASEFIPVDPAEREKRKWWLWVPAVIALCVLSGVIALRWSKTGFPWEDPAALGMAIKETGTQLDVTWNRNSRPVRVAQSATLTIQDGVVTRSIDMTPEQLRDGRVRYSRVTGDVMMRLEVTPAEGDKVSESVRVLSAEAPPATITPAVPPPAPPKTETPKTETPKPAVQQPAAEAPKAAPQTATTEEPPLRKTRRTRRAAKKTEAVEPKPEPEAVDPTLGLRPGRRK